MKKNLTELKEEKKKVDLKYLGVIGMKDYEKDEIIEELWKIEDEFSASCDRDVGKIIEKMNRIAVEQALSGKEVNLREKTHAA